MDNLFVLNRVATPSPIQKYISPPRPRQTSLQYELLTKSLRPLTKKKPWQKKTNSGLRTPERPLAVFSVRALFTFVWTNQRPATPERKKARENSNCLNRNSSKYAHTAALEPVKLKVQSHLSRKCLQITFLSL